MSHVVIIIQRSPPTATATPDDAAGISYEYAMPVPHNSTAAEVGEMVRKAYRRLEGTDPA